MAKAKPEPVEVFPFDVPPRLTQQIEYAQGRINEVCGGDPRPEAHALARLLVATINKSGPHKNIVMLDAIGLMAGVLLQVTPARHRPVLKLRLDYVIEGVEIPEVPDG